MKKTQITRFEEYSRIIHELSQLPDAEKRPNARAIEFITLIGLSIDQNKEIPYPLVFQGGFDTIELEWPSKEYTLQITIYHRPEPIEVFYQKDGTELFMKISDEEMKQLNRPPMTILIDILKKLEK